jgi:Outer membrane protein beta-barrel domain
MRKVNAAAAVAALGLCLAAAGPAAAQRYQRFDRDDDGSHPHRGLYAAIGGGVGLQLPDFPTDNGTAFFGELRLGFSVNRALQIFLSVDTGGANHSDIGFLQTTNILAALRYFLYYDQTFGVYFRGGLGIGIVSNPQLVSGPGAETAGLAEAGGVGMEIRLDKRWALTPEFFYRRTDETSDWRVDTLGFAILLNYN